MLEQGERERKATAATMAKEDAAARKEAAQLAKESEVRKRSMHRPNFIRIDVATFAFLPVFVV